MDVFEKVQKYIDKSASGEEEEHDFFYFEPWDVEERTPDILQKAKDDGFDLTDPTLVDQFGSDPHPFQTGYMLSNNKFRALNGGSQIGKSYAPKVEVWIMATGQIPYALRYEKGVDTGVKRKVTDENIRRFGRRNIDSEEVIDYNVKANKDGTWNCGNILGVGIYPSEKIAPPGSQIWIGTYSEAKTTYWWPSLADNMHNEFPEKFYDRTKGNNGLNKTDGIVYTQRGCRIMFLTYEMGHKRFEAKMAWAFIGDEEMPDQDIYNSAIQHAIWRSIVMTPLNGITFMKDILFPADKSKLIDIFHATQYDSPYQDKNDLESRRSGMAKWYRGSRIWGIFTDITGQPFYDREKLNMWLRSFTKVHKWATFAPTDKYFGIKSQPRITPILGLMDTPVRMYNADADDLMSTWRIYEDRKPGIGYLLTCDPSEGAETPDEVGDIAAAIISRQPIGEETKPVIVATIRSTLEAKPFARSCSFAMRYYNNAVCAAERGRGSANEAFGIEVEDYPHWFKFVTTQNSTGRQREKKGFDTNASTRDTIFDDIGDWLDEFNEEEYPCIPDEPLLRELSAAVVGKTASGKKRCDHTSNGTLDSAVAFGIMCYIHKNNPDQIKCNVREEPRQTNRSRFRKSEKSKVPCGLSGLGYRNGGS